MKIAGCWRFGVRPDVTAQSARLKYDDSMNPKRASYGVALALLELAVGVAVAQNPKPKLTKTPLTSVEAVTDIDAPRDPDDPGTGGAVDSSNYFSRRLAAKIGNCTDRIRSETDAWAKKYQLGVSKVDRQPGDLLMHMTKPDLAGFFELTYRIALHQERARVTLFFYSKDGARHEPAGIKKLLTDYKIDDLQDLLTKGLLCE
jgi:hypothetical protein